MYTLVKLMLVASAIYVYHDASKNKIGRIPGQGGFFNLPAGAWALGTLWLWIIFFPMYLNKREELIQKAQEHPREASYTKLKLGIFAFMFVGLLLQGFSGDSNGSWGGGTITFAEEVDGNLNTTNEGNEFSTGWVHMVVRSTEPFDDTSLTVFGREEGASAWVSLEQHVVSAEWDTCTFPVNLDVAGIYEIKVETSKGKFVAEGTVYVN